MLSLQGLPQATFVPTNSAQGFPVSALSHQHSPLVFIVAILTGTRWHFIVVVICISQMIGNVEHFPRVVSYCPLVCLLPTKKFLVRSFAQC